MENRNIIIFQVVVKYVCVVDINIGMKSDLLRRDRNIKLVKTRLSFTKTSLVKWNFMTLSYM